MQESCRLRRGAAYRKPTNGSAGSLGERHPLAHVVAGEGVHEVLRFKPVKDNGALCVLK